MNHQPPVETDPTPPHGITRPGDELLDWHGAQRRFAETFDQLMLRNPQPAIRGVNFITNELLGYVQTPDGQTVEISTGMFPVLGARPRRDVRVYGVTFARERDRSRLCESIDEAAALVRGEIS